MMMMKSILFVALLATYVAAHAGIKTPSPRAPACTAESALGDCGLTDGPCGGIDAEEPSVIETGDNTVVIFQRVSHANTNNTYTINWIADDDSVTQLAVHEQTEEEADGEIEIEIPVSIPEDAGKGSIQMIFDATPGGGDVYYSCADVTIEEEGSASTIAVSSILFAAVLALFA